MYEYDVLARCQMYFNVKSRALRAHANAGREISEGGWMGGWVKSGASRYRGTVLEHLTGRYYNPSSVRISVRE